MHTGKEDFSLSMWDLMFFVSFNMPLGQEIDMSLVYVYKYNVWNLTLRSQDWQSSSLPIPRYPRLPANLGKFYQNGLKWDSLGPIFTNLNQFEPI